MAVKDAAYWHGAFEGASALRKVMLKEMRDSKLKQRLAAMPLEQLWRQAGKEQVNATK